VSASVGHGAVSPASKWSCAQRSMSVMGALPSGGLRRLRLAVAWRVVADVGFELVFLPVGEAQCLGVNGELSGGAGARRGLGLHRGGGWAGCGAWEEGRRVDLEEGADGADVSLGDEVDVVVENVVVALAGGAVSVLY
jgi:hypothetical protein